ncbi:MAG: uracil-xanthine permease family protein [Pseudomonadales bacterium]
MNEPLIRYEPDQSPPHGLAAGLAAQSVALTLSGIVLTPAIVLRAGGVDAITLAWAVFAALVVSGITTMLQARPLGRIGAGYVLFMGTSGAFIAVSIAALEAGGMAMLMTLVILSSLVEFMFASRLGALRRVITPTIGGITVMLITVTIMPIAFGMLSTAPGTPAANAPLGAAAAFLVTLAVTVGLTLFGGPRLRLWSPLVGLALGTAVAAQQGLVNVAPVLSADWIGVPRLAWPGFDLEFDQRFWALLPAFIIVTLVSAIETYGDGIAIQQVSWRRPRAINYRSVQGAINADAVGNLLSGLAGTLPNTTYSTSISTVEMTGVAARRVGVYGGVLFIALAFSPKLAAILLAVPDPVVSAYMVVLLVMLFMHGLAMATREGLTAERMLVIGLALWLGIGFQGQLIFADHLPEWAANLLNNGMTAGTLVAVFLTLAIQLQRGRARRLETELSMSVLPDAHALVMPHAEALGWDREHSARLELVLEEALACLIDQNLPEDAVKGRRLRIETRAELGGIEIALVTGPAGANLGDRTLDQLPDAGTHDADTDAMIRSTSFRLLSTLADRVTHQQFHALDVLTLLVLPRPTR